MFARQRRGGDMGAPNCDLCAFPSSSSVKKKKEKKRERKGERFSIIITPLLSSFSVSALLLLLLLPPPKRNQQQLSFFGPPRWLHSGPASGVGFCHARLDIRRSSPKPNRPTASPQKGTRWKSNSHLMEMYRSRLLGYK